MEPETKSPQAAPGTHQPRPVSPWLVFLLLFVVYNVNFRCVRFGDSVPSRVLPFSLLLDHSLYLDRWVEPFAASADPVNGIYFLRKSHGHWMSSYPVIMPLAITPLYVLPSWLVARQNPPLHQGDILLTTLIDLMAKLSASLMAALSALILYAALRRIASPDLSLLATLVYGLAGTPWSISSQGLWRHGFTQLCFAGLLWGLLQDEGSSRRPFWCGLALAGAAANNAANAIFVLPFLIYFARRGRREFAAFFAPLAVLGSLVLGYNFYFFGKLLGGYPRVWTATAAGIHVYKAAPVWEGAAGLLFSPGRGLLIFMPWTILALWGMARAWKQNKLPAVRYLMVGMVGFFAAHSAMGTWWGGWCFGPRYMGDLLPFLALFLIPVWPQVRSRRPLAAAACMAIAVSMGIQAVGAFYYPRGEWDAHPANVDWNPQRLWDWKDNPIRRSWNAGRARPELFYGLFLLGNLVKRNQNLLPPPRQRKQGGYGSGEREQFVLPPLGKRAKSPTREKWAGSGRDDALGPRTERADIGGKGLQSRIGQTSQKGAESEKYFLAQQIEVVKEQVQPVPVFRRLVAGSLSIAKVLAEFGRHRHVAAAQHADLKLEPHFGPEHELVQQFVHPEEINHGAGLEPLGRQASQRNSHLRHRHVLGDNFEQAA
jgi:hypothetical protein